jgi:hypothetical protein
MIFSTIVTRPLRLEREVMFLHHEGAFAVADVGDILWRALETFINSILTMEGRVIGKSSQLQCHP